MHIIDIMLLVHVLSAEGANKPHAPHKQQLVIRAIQRRSTCIEIAAVYVGLYFDAVLTQLHHEHHKHC